MSAKVDVGACVSYGFGALKNNFGFHLVASIILLIVNGMSAGVLAGPLLLGYYKALAKAEAGQNPEIGDLFGCFDKFVPSFLVTLLCAILIGIGYFFFILPGILIAPLLPAALAIVEQGENDAIVAIKKAWACIQPNFIMAAIALFIVSLFSCVGALACGVGVVFTLPIGIAGMYKLGRQLTSA